jgi:hypothetical protein
LRGGSLKSACFSALGNGSDTLRTRLWVRSRHPASVRTGSDSSLRSSSSGVCPMRTCADHAPMLRTRRVQSVPMVCPGRVEAVSRRLDTAPNEHLCVAGAFARAPLAAHVASFHMRRSPGVPATVPGAYPGVTIGPQQSENRAGHLPLPRTVLPLLRIWCVQAVSKVGPGPH